MSATDRLVANATGYPPNYRPSVGHSARPSAGVAIVACMDARLDIHALFGLKLGEAHIIRNAGGLLTDDAVRSLVLSQRLLGTTEVILVHHTGCGLEGLDDEEFASSLAEGSGVRPSWRAGGFADPYEDVRRSMAALLSDPFVPEKNVRGFVFDVSDGTLREVT